MGSGYSWHTYVTFVLVNIFNVRYTHTLCRANSAYYLKIFKTKTQIWKSKAWSAMQKELSQNTISTVDPF